jgi:hypothetical protein
MAGPRPVRDQQASFSGGLNTVSDPLALSPDQFRFGRNARHTEYGALTKRFGSVRLSSNAITGLPLNGYNWAKADGSVQALVVGDTGALWRLDALQPLGTQAWVSAAGLSTTVIPTFAEFVQGSSVEVVYIGDGGRINRWDGTALTTDIGAGPGVRYLTVHNQRLWSCGCAVAPSSIFYSSLNNGDTIGDPALGGGEIVVRTFGDERIVALASCNSSLLIFHTRGLSRLTGFGQDDITVDPEGISSQTGTIAPFSVVEGDGVVFFISDRGAFAANESGVVPLGTPDRPDPILPVISTLTPAQLALVRGVLSRKTQEVWFQIPGIGTYVYHLVLQAWAGPWTEDHAHVNGTGCMWAGRVGDFAETYVMQGLSGGIVTVSDVKGVGTDRATLSLPSSGTPIPWSVQLRRLYFEDDSLAKSLRYAYVTAQLPSLEQMEVFWQTNFGPFSPQAIVGSSAGAWSVLNTWGLGRWGAGANSQNYRLWMSGTGYYVDVTLSHDGVGTPVVSRVQMDAFALGRR